VDCDCADSTLLLVASKLSLEQSIFSDQSGVEKLKNKFSELPSVDAPLVSFLQPTKRKMLKINAVCLKIIMFI
jgi:hypothetical protein